MYPRGFCARFASAARAFQDKNAGAAAVFFAGVFRRWTRVVAAAGERGSSPPPCGGLIGGPGQLPALPVCYSSSLNI